jgi:hypothetical protein
MELDDRFFRSINEIDPVLWDKLNEGKPFLSRQKR